MQRVLWYPTCGFGKAPAEYVAAARACDAAAVSASPVALARLPGTEQDDLVRYARDLGVAISCVDSVHSWLPLEGTPLHGRAPTIDSLLLLAERFGCTSFNAVAVDAGLDEFALADHFGAFCDRAADVGCTVHLEFSPLGAVSDLARAWAIVRAADRRNGGILLDSWHFFRGRGDLALLASVPGDRIFAVQLSDAAATPVGDLWNDTLHHRKLPGDGSFPLDRLVAVLVEIGGLSSYGPEVISDDLHALGPVGAATVAMRRCANLIATG